MLFQIRGISYLQGRPKEMVHFIWIFEYSSVLKHFSELGPGALILKFHNAVQWISHIQAHTHIARYYKCKSHSRWWISRITNELYMMLNWAHWLRYSIQPLTEWDKNPLEKNKLPWWEKYFEGLHKNVGWKE